MYDWRRRGHYDGENVWIYAHTYAHTTTSATAPRSSRLSASLISSSSKLQVVCDCATHHSNVPTILFYKRFCLRNTVLVLRYQIRPLQTVPVLSGAFEVVGDIIANYLEFCRPWTLVLGSTSAVKLHLSNLPRQLSTNIQIK